MADARSGSNPDFDSGTDAAGAGGGGTAVLLAGTGREGAGGAAVIRAGPRLEIVPPVGEVFRDAERVGDAGIEELKAACVAGDKTKYFSPRACSASRC